MNNPEERISHLEKEISDLKIRVKQLAIILAKMSNYRGAKWPDLIGYYDWEKGDTG
tara:strand:+ start:195 stop:362 length:168 start_codon:yes stop_codon:yes gene_type:complete